MCQSTSLMEAATVGCSRSILSALHPLRSSAKKRLNHPRPRWSRRDSTGGGGMDDRYPETWKLSSCELGHARMVAVRTRRYLSSWHEVRGSADRAIAHWRDAGRKWTIIVIPNSSHLLCAMSKIAFCTKNRITTQNCAGADVTVTSCFCTPV